MPNQDKPLCFVIMPFSEDYDEIYERIKCAGTGVGFLTERANEEYSPCKVPDRIEYLLETASTMVAEITDKNPNVYYELGWAHAKNKPVVLICKGDTDLPFDIKHWNHINYEGETELFKKLGPALDKLFSEAERQAELSKKGPPKDLEVGQLAVKCGMISNEVLDKRLIEFKSGQIHYDSLLELMIKSNDIDKEKAEMLSQAQKWVSEYLESFSQALSEPIWIKRLHRTVKFISWQDRSNAESIPEKRYVDILDKEIDVFDEAIFTDNIFFQKLKKQIFEAQSSGIVLLHEREAKDYSVFIPEAHLPWYLGCHGQNLKYTVSIKENSTLPILVERNFTYLNGFQEAKKFNHKEAGIRIGEHIEDLELTIDFELLRMEIRNPKAELRYENEDKITSVDIKEAGQYKYYVSLQHPPIGTALYIVWEW